MGAADLSGSTEGCRGLAGSRWIERAAQACLAVPVRRVDNGRYDCHVCGKCIMNYSQS